MNKKELLETFKEETQNIKTLTQDYVYGVLHISTRKTAIIENMAQAMETKPGEAPADQEVYTTQMLVLGIGDRCSDEFKSKVKVGSWVRLKELDLQPFVTPYGMSPDKGAPPQTNPNCSIFSFASQRQLKEYDRKGVTNPTVLMREYQIVAVLQSVNV